MFARPESARADSGLAQDPAERRLRSGRLRGCFARPESARADSGLAQDPAERRLRSGRLRGCFARPESARADSGLAQDLAETVKSEEKETRGSSERGQRTAPLQLLRQGATMR